MIILLVGVRVEAVGEKTSRDGHGGDEWEGLARLAEEEEDAFVRRRHPPVRVRQPLSTQQRR
jgi:hypothetical protein